MVVDEYDEDDIYNEDGYDFDYNSEDDDDEEYTDSDDDDDLM